MNKPTFYRRLTAGVDHEFDDPGAELRLFATEHRATPMPPDLATDLLDETEYGKHLARTNLMQQRRYKESS